jgi:hypothetical protein
VVRFRQKVNSHGKIYIVKPLRESGLTGVIEIIPNAKAAVIYRAGTRIQDIMASLEVIMAHLRLQAQDNENAEKEKGAGR